jgi:hypothetical protein
MKYSPVFYFFIHYFKALQMALTLALTNLQQTNCTEWVLTDASGAYNAVSNPTGWSTTANPGTLPIINDSTVTYAELIITLPSGGSVTIDIIDNWADLTGYATAAFAVGTDPLALSYTVTAAMLGASTIADGIYNVTYQIGDGTTYANSTNRATISYNYASYCLIECAIETLLVCVPANYQCASCDNDYLNKVSILWTLLQALKLAACSANVDSFTNILTTLQTAVEESGCTCN